MFFTFFIVQWSMGQGRVTVSGFVSDSLSGERVIGASVFFPELNTGTVSNEHGFFSAKIPSGETVRLEASFVGYSPLKLNLELDKDSLLRLKLVPMELPTFTVQANKKRIVHDMNAIRILSPSNLPYPSLKTEIDIMDVIRQMPGVQPGLEGTTGFSVRGGNNDQNLLLMDHIPLYNTSHLANFVSIFDPYVINSMTFHKGGFPAQYGGRASSVLDIYLKEGSKQTIKGESNLGLLFGKLALEGPIVNDKTSFLVSFRRSFTDLFLKGANMMTQTGSEFLYSFYDLNAKLSHNFREGSDLYFSFYSGRDRLSTDAERTLTVAEDLRRTYANHQFNRWGNTSASLRWTKVINNSTLWNSILAFSNFNYELADYNMIFENEVTDQRNFYQYGSKVQDFLFKNELEWKLNSEVEFKTGLHLVRHSFSPVDWTQERSLFRGAFESRINSEVHLGGTEVNYFIQSNLDIFDKKLSIQPGIRLGVYSLDEGFIHPLVEPRLNTSWTLSPQSKLSFSYSRMNQTVHSLNTSGIALIPDIWIPATERLKPSSSDEVSFFWNRFFQNTGINGQIGVYYRSMENLIQFDGNTGFATIQDQWDHSIHNEGTGYAYGMEISADKSFDKLQLEANYTFSRSFRKFEELNRGAYFPHIFDRPHNLTFTGIMNLNQKSTISAQWNFQSGQPITFGSQVYPAINNHYFYGDLISFPDNVRRSNNSRLSFPHRNVFESPLLIEEINNFRMPEFHRLDLSFTHEKEWRNGILRKVNVSIYNAYNRMNPYFIYSVREDGKLSFKKLTLFPILPSFSYGIRF